MKSFTHRLLTVVIPLLFCASGARSAPTVYDLRIDFSDSINPNGTWRYYKGNTLLTHSTPVTNATLALATTNGFWGDTSSSNNSAIMKTTANGSATGSWTDSDFLVNEVLVRTTDPASGGPMLVTWTAPSAGTFTYNGFIWLANGPLGPGGNSFALWQNNLPPIETGQATIGQNRTNVSGFVNGATPVNVLAGDVLSLQIDSIAPFPTGSLAGVSFTIDFTPLPEPTGLTLIILGLGPLLARRPSGHGHN